MSFFLKDRIKETSRSTGTGDFTLDGAAPGFSAFGDYYSDGDTFFYAITDGQAYEVGSGVYNVGASNTLTRFPIQSTNSDSVVSFTAGLKEVFVTYPGRGSVYSAKDYDSNQQPADSGVAFYSSDQIVNYDRMLVWDSGKSSLGVGQESPNYAIDVGSDIDYSIVRASGFIDGGSGVLFSGVLGSYSGGRQLEPFMRNVTNNETGSDAVILLSGVVNQGILLQKQIPRTIFAGPSGNCDCVDDYPTFRLLDVDDLPLLDIDYRYVRQANVGLDGQSINAGNGSFRSGSVAIYSASGYITYDSGVYFDAMDNRLLIRDNSNRQDPTATLDVDGDIHTTNLQASGFVLLDGDLITSGTVVTDEGVNISNYVPSNTSNTIYNNAGTLYWENTPLGTPGAAYSFDVTDGLQPADTILNGESLTVSGVSGVNVTYDSSDNLFLVSASGLSGVLQEQIDNLAPSAPYSFDVTNGELAGDTISNAETLTFFGLSGIRVEYNPNDTSFRIGASGLSGVLQDQLTEQLDYLSNENGPISLSGVSGIALYASGWIDSFTPSPGGGGSATSGVALVDDHFVLDQEGSGLLKRLGLSDDLAVILGTSGCHGASQYTEGVFIGSKAGAESQQTQKAVGVSSLSLYEAVNVSGTIAIGDKAGFKATNSTNCIYLGAIAGSGRVDREGDVIFSNSQSSPTLYNPTTGLGNGKNGTGWTNTTDSIFEMTTAFQGYINNLEDDSTRDVRLHIGHPLATPTQLKSTLQLQRTDESDYHLFLENDENDLSGSEENMAIADSPLKGSEDGIPFVGPSGFMRVPWCWRDGSDNLMYNGDLVPEIDGSIVGWMNDETNPTTFGWAIGFFKGLPPLLGITDGWVFHTGVKP